MTDTQILLNLFLNPWRMNGDVNGVAIFIYMIMAILIITAIIEHKTN